MHDYHVMCSFSYYMLYFSFGQGSVICRRVPNSPPRILSVILSVPFLSVLGAAQPSLFILYHISPGGNVLCAFPRAPVLAGLPYSMARKESGTELTFGFRVKLTFTRAFSHGGSTTNRSILGPIDSHSLPRFTILSAEAKERTENQMFVFTRKPPYSETAHRGQSVKHAWCQDPESKSQVAMKFEESVCSGHYSISYHQLNLSSRVVSLRRSVRYGSGFVGKPQYIYADKV